MGIWDFLNILSIREKLKYLQLICWYKIVHINKDILDTWRHFKIFMSGILKTFSFLLNLLDFKS